MKFKRILSAITLAIMLANSVLIFADTESVKINDEQQSDETTISLLSNENEDNILSGSSVEIDEKEENTEENGEYVAKEYSPMVPKIMAPKDIVLNPYMGNIDGSIHNDTYSTDVVPSVAPLGIYPEVSYGREPDSYNATPNAYYDDEGRAIAAYQGGIAIKDLSKDKVEVLGGFIPSRDETTPYSVQTSYSFVDCDGNIVFPTSHGHIGIVSPTDENGNILKVFDKIFDVDIVSEAKKALGEDIDGNVLSIIYDYDGNLWFVSGGFRKDPAYSKDGFIGMLSRSYIEQTINGANLNVSDYVSIIRLSSGENAENGISSCPDGVVILTNKSCYLLNDDNGVNIKWKVDYDSVLKKPLEGTNVTGLGLAWGGGSTPTLTNELALFTDNAMPVNLKAVSLKTGEVVASIPILDSLTGIEQVSVENSILVYSPSPEKTSVIVCNWFGAGNPGLDSPDADSSIQTYDNIYDANWMKEGNKYISPGVERIDILKDGSGWHMEKVWTREDIRDTSMIKLSTSTGYLYGYWQNMDTNYWGYNILDFDTGETTLEMPVSTDPNYNNMAVGMISDINGVAMYCPTNDKTLLRLQDRFVYMPNHKEVRLNLDETARKNITESDFYNYSGKYDTPVSYLSTAAFNTIDSTDVIAFRVNGITSKKVTDLQLYAMGKDGKLKAVDDDKWELTDETGLAVNARDTIVPRHLYEIRMNAQDADEFDLCDEDNKVKVSVILCKVNEVVETTTETTTEATTEMISEATTEGRRPSSGGGRSVRTQVTTVSEQTQSTTETEYTETTTTSSVSDNTKSETEQEMPFIDFDENAWYADSVKYVYDNGIFSGITDNLFGSDKEVTRGMAVTVLGRLAGINTADYTNSSYTDVDSNMYYAPYIKWATDNNIVAGFGNGIFKPDSNITREQLTRIIKNYNDYMGNDTSVDNIELPFGDTSMVSNWAMDGLQYCYSNGIVSGDDNGMFNPKNDISRAELAEIIKNVMTMPEK